MLLEEAIVKEFGEEMKSSNELCSKIWAATTNTDWYYKNDEEGQGFTFREAGGVIADIIGRGTYMDWYMSAPAGEVNPEISERMSRLGWRHVSL